MGGCVHGKENGINWLISDLHYKQNQLPMLFSGLYNNTSQFLV